MIVLICLTSLLVGGFFLRPFTAAVAMTAGLLVEEDGDLLSHRATWTIVVLLERPSDGPILAREIEYLSTIIHLRFTGVNRDVRNSWVRRLRWLNTGRVNGTKIPSCDRRSLLPFLGKLSTYLFGTVNEEQLQDIKRLTQESIARSKGIVHSFNSLLSLVNNTQDGIEDNQIHIDALNRCMVAMRTEFDQEKSILRGDCLKLH